MKGIPAQLGAKPQWEEDTVHEEDPSQALGRVHSDDRQGDHSAGRDETRYAQPAHTLSEAVDGRAGHSYSTAAHCAGSAIRASGHQWTLNRRLRSSSRVSNQ